MEERLGSVWDNIKLRQQIKERLVEANQESDKQLLEADFVVKANQRYHILSQRVREEYGDLDNDRIFARWDEWLQQQV